MITTLNASDQILDAALDASRKAGFGGRKLTGLNADLDNTLRGRLQEVWDSVEEAIRKAFVEGKQQARSLIEDSQRQIEELLKQAGAKARDLHASLLERMRVFVREFLGGALAMMPESIPIGAGRMKVKGFTCAQKIHLGGKLEVNLFKLCELVSEGEFEVTVEYGLEAAAGVE